MPGQSQIGERERESWYRFKTANWNSQAIGRRSSRRNNVQMFILGSMGFWRGPAIRHRLSSRVAWLDSACWPQTIQQACWWWLLASSSPLNAKNAQFERLGRRSLNLKLSNVRPYQFTRHSRVESINLARNIQRDEEKSWNQRPVMKILQSCIILFALVASVPTASVKAQNKSICQAYNVFIYLFNSTYFYWR